MDALMFLLLVVACMGVIFFIIFSINQICKVIPKNVVITVLSIFVIVQSSFILFFDVVSRSARDMYGNEIPNSAIYFEADLWEKTLVIIAILAIILGIIFSLKNISKRIIVMIFALAGVLLAFTTFGILSENFAMGPITRLQWPYYVLLAAFIESAVLIVTSLLGDNNLSTD